MNELLEFAKQNPWPPHWPEETNRRFMTDLVSTEELIIDLQDGKERVAVAVLLDKVQNKGNFANLEVLGISKLSDPIPLLQEILSQAKSRVPSSRAGLELAIHESFSQANDFAERNDLTLYYETIEMRHDSPGLYGERADTICEVPLPEDDRELYGALVDSFKENVDTSIPSFEDWQMTRRRPSHSKTWIVRNESRVAGFLNLVIPQDLSIAEIRTIGVLPAERGRGLASALIRHALSHVARLNITECKLTVAIQNKRALELYRRLGFTEHDSYRVYSWKRPSR